MRADKQATFVKRMRLKKGGLVPRKKMASGGTPLGPIGLPTPAPGAPGSANPGDFMLGGPNGVSVNTVFGHPSGYNSQVPGGGTTVGQPPPVTAGNAPTTGLGYGYTPSVPGLIEPVTGATATDAMNGANTAVAQQQGLVNNLNAVNGIGHQNQVFNQLEDVAAGRGPNPALMKLRENTASNVAEQGALMAGQRGAAANPALMARQVAQQGAATQQTAVEQEATLQAEQALAATGKAGEIATNQAGNQINQTVEQAQLRQAQQAAALDAIASQNATNASMQQNINNVNAGLAGAVMGATGQVVSGVANAIGSAAPFAAGTSSSIPSDLADVTLAKGGEVSYRPVAGPHASHVANFLFAGGGEVPGDVPALVSPGEIYLAPDQVKDVQHGANPFKVGHKFKGSAKVKGDSTENDTIPTTLQEGGVVLPRHIVNKMSPDKARLFVLKALAKKGRA